MAQGSRLVSDVLTIMRLAISRRDTNNADSGDTKLLSYINDFMSLKMSDDIRMFEQFGTLEFNIDETNTSGVYTFNDVGADTDFVSISNEALISILDPVNESVSWNHLYVCRDPGDFFYRWGINNDDVLIAGFPTEVLFYGNELTFRTIPEQEYVVKIYGYKKRNDFTTTSEEIPFDRWLRYLAYGAAIDYARDYNYSLEKIKMLQKTFMNERNNMLAHTHNEITMQRGRPSF